MKMKARLIRGLHAMGLEVLEPLVRLAWRDDPRKQTRLIGLYLGVPTLAFMVFLGLWSAASQAIVTNYGTLPTPAQVWREAVNLAKAHRESRAAQQKYYADQEARAAQFEEQAASLARSAGADPSDRHARQIALLEERATGARERRYSASPTYLDQILTSLKTVFAGFLVASALAIPIGILCGLSPVFMSAMNPLIQIFKPVSPLAWLPIVMICVGALYTTDPQQAWFEKSFISSAFTVSLCSLWPTLVNTALGVASIDKDHINVARVLKLPWTTRIRKIVVPSALPLIFAGLRISLGVGWMVLIAAEMLAQNPGLGKFVWDMFQNGSSQTLAQIMVAVFTIGIVGFLLDRAMIVLQRLVGYDVAPA
jgi:nitrate/nitrite transport system permease protein